MHMHVYICMFTCIYLYENVGEKFSSISCETAQSAASLLYS